MYIPLQSSHSLRDFLRTVVVQPKGSNGNVHHHKSQGRAGLKIVGSLSLRVQG